MAKQIYENVHVCDRCERPRHLHRYITDDGDHLDLCEPCHPDIDEGADDLHLRCGICMDRLEDGVDTQDTEWGIVHTDCLVRWRAEHTVASTEVTNDD